MPVDADIVPGAFRVGVIGGGSWGTVLAGLLAAKGFPVDLWVFEPEVAQQINTHRENRAFLPGIPLSPSLTASNDLARPPAAKTCWWSWCRRT
jgi:glycerol-3-phosphate dehydrogenase (NAD(P)+)